MSDTERDALDQVVNAALALRRDWNASGMARATARDRLLEAIIDAGLVDSRLYRATAAHQRVPRPVPLRTVRVDILVGVNARGDWSAVGASPSISDVWGNQSPESVVSDDFCCREEPLYRLHRVEATLPLPDFSIPVIEADAVHIVDPSTPEGDQ